MEVIHTDFLVIGSGVAGLTAALSAAAIGKVTIIAKDSPDRCNTTLAQGGIAAAVSSADSPALHSADTMRAGAGICQAETVDLLTGSAPRVIQTLCRLGTRFDRTTAGDTALALEGAHSVPRVLHHGDSTGAEIWRALHEQVRQTAQIRSLAGSQALNLVIANGHCTGAIAATPGGIVQFRTRAVILATGGCGQIFGRTTNSPVCTGDGLALAWRAGATLADMEFIQFHPTALDLGESPLFLISEAVRGEGAYLVNEQGSRFMKSYHPLADLAPRDVVSRAILAEQTKGQRVYLDATGIGPHFAERFPTIYANLQQNSINPAESLIPVTPAAHFTIGGVQTDVQGRTTIPGLFACGEVASTGVHGANRLASNSLLEGIVFGQRIAKALASLPVPERHSASPADDPSVLLSGLRTDGGKQAAGGDWVLPKPLEYTDPRLRELQTLMWTHVGIVRDGAGMLTASRRLAELATQTGPGEYELSNMIAAAGLVTQSALAREESRGSHFRTDYPEANPDWQSKHLYPRRQTA